MDKQEVMQENELRLTSYMTQTAYSESFVPDMFVLNNVQIPPDQGVSGVKEFAGIGRLHEINCDPLFLLE